MQNITPLMVLQWVEANPKRYYRNGEIYGLVATTEGADGVLYISAMVISEDAPFTKEMLKDIIALYKKRVICLVTDVKSKQELIRRVLTRYNFTYKYIDGVLFSTGGGT